MGFWLRCMLTHSFWFCLLGQTVIAIGQPLIYNLPAKVSAEWFPEGERLFSTMVGVNSSILGVVIGFFLPVTFVTIVPSVMPLEVADDEYRVRKQIQWMLIMMSVVESALFALLFCFFVNSDIQIQNQ